MSADSGLRANILQPSPGDLLVLKAEVGLSQEQRERIKATVTPLLEGMGCKVLVLEKGFDLVLVKQAYEISTGA